AQLADLQQAEGAARISRDAREKERDAAHDYLRLIAERLHVTRAGLGGHPISLPELILCTIDEQQRVMGELEKIASWAIRSALPYAEANPWESLLKAAAKAGLAEWVPTNDGFGGEQLRRSQLMIDAESRLAAREQTDTADSQALGAAKDE